jgi:hypothetical protein
VLVRGLGRLYFILSSLCSFVRPPSNIPLSAAPPLSETLELGCFAPNAPSHLIQLIDDFAHPRERLCIVLCCWCIKTLVVCVQRARCLFPSFLYVYTADSRH